MTAQVALFLRDDNLVVLPQGGRVGRDFEPTGADPEQIANRETVGETALGGLRVAARMDG